MISARQSDRSYHLHAAFRLHRMMSLALNIPSKTIPLFGKHHHASFKGSKLKRKPRKGRSREEEMHDEEEKESTKQKSSSSGLAPIQANPEGFLSFFLSDADVPDPPSGKHEQMQMDVMGISIQWSYPLVRLGFGAVSKEDLEAVDKKLQELKLLVAESEFKLLSALDDEIFRSGEMNCSRKVYGPVDLRIGPLNDNVVLESKGYVVLTVHNQGVVTLAVTTNLANSTNKVYVDQIQSLQDAYFYDKEIFSIDRKTRTLLDFFNELRRSIAQVLPDMENVRGLGHVSVSIRKTDPPFANAWDFAAKHAYEMIAMLGEEADWRQAEKSIVREILAYGLKCKSDDLAIPQEFASVVFDGSLEGTEAEAFDTFGLISMSLLDIHAVAAWTAFGAIRKLLDAQIQACTDAGENDYRRIIQETNRLLSRYLQVKQSFTNVDQLWKDAAYAWYVNYSLELYTATKKMVRTESLDAVIDALRALTSQMADIVQRRSESRTNLSLQLVGLFLSGAAILDLVKLAGDAYSLDAFSQFWIALSAWGAVALIILLVGLLRR
jgi:hypothetical protein